MTHVHPVEKGATNKKLIIDIADEKPEWTARTIATFLAADKAGIPEVGLSGLKDKVTLV